MPNFKLPKFNPNIIFILISLTVTLGLGMYFVYQKYSKPVVNIQPLETVATGELNNVLKERLENEPEYGLYGRDWVWVSTEISSAQAIKPLRGDFVLKITDDGKFSSTSDCNGISGKYLVVNSSIYFRDIASTKMFCPKSKDSGYISNLE